MTNAAFDTMKYLQKLKAAGIPERHAIALTEAQNEAFMESTDHIMATRADLLELKQEVKQDFSDFKAEIRQDFTDFKIEIRQDFTDFKIEIAQDFTDFKTEITPDFTDFKTEVKQDIAGLRTEVKHDIADLKTEFNIKFVHVESTLKLHNWMIGFVLTGIGALIIRTFFA